jgi:hypothetical protein
VSESIFLDWKVVFVVVEYSLAMTLHFENRAEVTCTACAAAAPGQLLFERENLDPCRSYGFVVVRLVSVFLDSDFSVFHAVDPGSTFVVLASVFLDSDFSVFHDVYHASTFVVVLGNVFLYSDFSVFHAVDHCSMFVDLVSVVLDSDF